MPVLTPPKAPKPPKLPSVTKAPTRVEVRPPDVRRHARLPTGPRMYRNAMRAQRVDFPGEPPAEFLAGEYHGDVGQVLLLSLVGPAWTYAREEWPITSPALGIPNAFRVAAIAFGLVAMLVLMLLHAARSGIGVILREWTSPQDLAVVDIERDELAFFPFLYWPVTANQTAPTPVIERSGRSSPSSSWKLHPGSVHGETHRYVLRQKTSAKYWH